MLILKPLFRLIDLLLDEHTPSRIGAGVALGFCLGVTPLSTLHGVFLWVLLCLVRVNLLSALLVALFVSELSNFIEPVFHRVGLFLLTGIPSLTQEWAWMFHAPIIPFTRFYNTIVMGRLIVAVLFAYPLYIVCERWVRKNQAEAIDKFLDSYFWRSIEESRIYDFYEAYEQQKGH